MFSKVAFAAVLCSSLTVGAAVAADLPMRSPPLAPFLAPPVFTWTGFYLGVNAGYDFSNESRFVQGLGNVLPVNSGLGARRPALVTVSDDGFAGGAQIGYNYQFGGFGAASVVAGIEADAMYTDINRNITVGGPTDAAVLNGFHSELDFLGTVRGRLGLAFDRTLVYGTGGLAYGEVNTAATFFNGPTGVFATTPRFAGSRDSVDLGYTVGGGIEYALPTGSFMNFFHSSAVTIKAEYLYYNLGTAKYNLFNTANGPANTHYATSVTTDGNIARLGINYKF